MKLRIKDLAKKAGVLVATISRAINPETRAEVACKYIKRIDDLIQQYVYTPNLAAKSLRRTSTKTIGVVFPYFSGIFYSNCYNHIFAGVSDFLLKTDYRFKLVLLKKEKNKWDQHDFRASERVDGLVITHWFMFFSKRSVLGKMNVPYVIVNDLDKVIKANFVYADHFSGSKFVAEHLCSLGHRNIAVVVGPAWSVDSNQRVKAFKETLMHNGIKLNPEHIISGDFLEDRAYKRTELLFKKKNKSTAIFCCILSSWILL